MSEIKGQILGMLLVLMVFGLVAGILYASFEKNANDISSRLNNETNFSIAKAALVVYPEYRA